MRRLVIFSHYDCMDIVDEYIIYYLESLKRISADIVFVSTSRLVASEIDKIKEFCIKVIVRDNIGYDFYSYKIGLLYCENSINKYDQIIFCNDSVYGPIFDIVDAFGRMQDTGYDFWGITENKEIRPHLQSFFLVFNRNIVNSGILFQFIKNIDIVHSKKDIIRKYEIGLTAILSKRGFTYGSVYKKPGLTSRLGVFKTWTLNANKNEKNVHSNNNMQMKRLIGNIRRTLVFFIKAVIQVRVNVTQYFWMDMIEQRIPFVKIDLIRSNPLAIPDTDRIVGCLHAKSDYPVEMITSHIVRTRSCYQVIH